MSSEDVSLCCCEYFDLHHQRNHILACCCNCSDLDEGFESLITGRGISTQRKSAVMATVQDRMRIPWRGGAKQIAVDAILPIIVIPAVLLLASISLWWTIFSFSTVIFFLAYVSYHFLRSIPQTKFFFVWSVTSVVTQYLIFEFLVIPFLQILVEENVALSVLILGFIFCVYFMKIRTSNVCTRESDAEGDPVGIVTRTNRTHNCSICRISIPEHDHHCVWLDTCVGHHNRCLFILCLFFAEGALLYSSNLTLTSVCHPFNFYWTILLPDDCSEVYEQLELSLSFVSALYSLGIAIVVFVMLAHQLLLVSLGLTGTEWRALPVSQKLCLGFTANRPYSKGFCANWLRIMSCRNL